jgi:hypothetical protein
MTRFVLAAALVALLILPPAALGGPGGKSPAAAARPTPRPGAVMAVRREGDAYCFERAIAVGSVIVAGGRCYTFYLLRTGEGAFLAFGPPGPPMIPPGQIVRLSTPAGAKHRGRLFYLVPVSVPLTVIRVDEIRSVPVVVTPQPGGVTIRIPAGGAGGQASGSNQRDPEVNFIEQH